jgi:hypothetical protein
MAKRYQTPPDQVDKFLIDEDDIEVVSLGRESKLKTRVEAGENAASAIHDLAVEHVMKLQDEIRRKQGGNS